MQGAADSKQNSPEFFDKLAKENANEFMRLLLPIPRILDSVAKPNQDTSRKAAYKRQAINSLQKIANELLVFIKDKLPQAEEANRNSNITNILAAFKRFFENEASRNEILPGSNYWGVWRSFFEMLERSNSNNKLEAEVEDWANQRGIFRLQEARQVRQTADLKKAAIKPTTAATRATADLKSTVPQAEQKHAAATVVVAEDSKVSATPDEKIASLTSLVGEEPTADESFDVLRAQMIILSKYKEAFKKLLSELIETFKQGQNEQTEKHLSRHAARLDKFINEILEQEKIENNDDNIRIMYSALEHTYFTQNSLNYLESGIPEIQEMWRSFVEAIEQLRVEQELRVQQELDAEVQRKALLAELDQARARLTKLATQARALLQEKDASRTEVRELRQLLGRFDQIEPSVSIEELRQLNEDLTNTMKALQEARDREAVVESSPVIPEQKVQSNQLDHKHSVPSADVSVERSSVLSEHINLEKVAAVQIAGASIAYAELRKQHLQQVVRTGDTPETLTKQLAHAIQLIGHRYLNKQYILSKSNSSTAEQLINFKTEGKNYLELLKQLETVKANIIAKDKGWFNWSGEGRLTRAIDAVLNAARAVAAKFPSPAVANPPTLADKVKAQLKDLMSAVENVLDKALAGKLVDENYNNLKESLWAVRNIVQANNTSLETLRHLYDDLLQRYHGFTLLASVHSIDKVEPTKFSRLEDSVGLFAHAHDHQKLSLGQQIIQDYLNNPTAGGAEAFKQYLTAITVKVAKQLADKKAGIDDHFKPLQGELERDVSQIKLPVSALETLDKFIASVDKERELLESEWMDDHSNAQKTQALTDMQGVQVTANLFRTVIESHVASAQKDEAPHQSPHL
jgi:hypothetical protein